MKRRFSACLSIIMIFVICSVVSVCVYSDDPAILPGVSPDESDAIDQRDNADGQLPTVQQSAGMQKLAITTGILPDGVKGQKYNAVLAAEGGAVPYAWQASGLPIGLSVVMYTGVISGTPVKAGTYSVEITMIDGNGKQASAVCKLVIREPGTKVQATKNGIKVKIGDYVMFGRYLGKPILWRVININEDGYPLLFSEKILTFKPYDAAEKGTTVKTTEDTTYAEDCGSSRWVNSNLREWLNSSDKKVKYTTQPPTKAAVESGCNYYSDEAGFLYNFTPAEQKLIEPEIHSAVLSSYDKVFAQGGELPLIYNYNTVIPSKAIENEDSAYFEMTTDKVFVPSIAEIAGNIEARGWKWARGYTEEAKKLAKEPDIYEGYGCYWLRTTCNSQLRGGIVCSIDWLGEVNRISPYIGSCGVCPALYMNIGAAVFESGSGTAAKPYIVKK